MLKIVMLGLAALTMAGCAAHPEQWGGRNAQGLTVDQTLANWQEKSDSVAANNSQPVRQTFSVDKPRT